MIERRHYTQTQDVDGLRVVAEIKEVRVFGFTVYRFINDVQRSASPITPIFRIACYERDDYECVYCGNDDRQSLAIDHVLPRIQGGTTTVENSYTSCKRCNSKKNRYTPEQAAMPPRYGRFRAVRRNAQPKNAAAMGVFYERLFELKTRLATPALVEPEYLVMQRAKDCFQHGMTTRELARVAGVSSQTAQDAIAEIETETILRLSKTGMSRSDIAKILKGRTQTRLAQIKKIIEG